MNYLRLACFGYTIYSYEYDSFKRVVMPSDNMLQNNYLIKGKLKVFKDNQFLCEKKEGDFLDDTFFTNGKFYIETLSECQLIHISNKDNRDFLPEIEPFFYKAKDKLKFEENTKLFLCLGTVKIEDKKIESPYQIFFIHEKTIEFLSDCYILKIK